MDDPVRWIDDPDAPRAMREDLRRVREIEAPPIDFDSGLVRASKRSWTPWIAAVLIVIATGSAIVYLIRPEPEPAVRSTPAPRAPIPAPTPTPAPTPSLPPAPIAEPAPVIEEARPAQRPPHRTIAPVAPIVEERGPSELVLVQQARNAMSSQPARALEVLREADRRYPNGIFLEERQAIGVLALIALHRDADARAQAERFLRAHPTTVYRQRIERALAE
jgi:hypothetical protein